MFDLEQAIANWRQQLTRSGVKTPVPMAELESHLRDGIQRQINLGVETQMAFAMATREIGPGASLQSEFGKNRRRKLKRIFTWATAVFFILFGPALILPAWAWRNTHGYLRTDQFLYLATGAFTLALGVALAARGFIKRTS